MRWKKGRRSTNIDDRRGSRVGRSATLGGGAVVVALLAALLLGQDPGQVLETLAGAGGGTGQRQSAPNPAEDQAADFVSVVLADTEDVWNGVFAASGQRYQPPVLVLYSGVTPTACGTGNAASGPFYCPGDSKLYLDLSFLSELQRMGASGDFAVAYVVAHEVGHHIQNVTGTAREVRRLQSGNSQRNANALQVRMELQADCYAGVWAHHGHRQRQILEQGDVEEGLQAAASVGDDHLQRMSGRGVNPESFTHGTSEQRMRWFNAGLKTGDTNQCDTFSATSL